jgi:hypothetical protein
MNVLAEDRHVFRQVPVDFRQMLIARTIGYVALGPALERVRATAADQEIESVRGLQDGIADQLQLFQHGVMPFLHDGADFEHALGNLVSCISRVLALRQKSDQVGRSAREVAVATVHDLQLKFHAHG